MAIFVVLGLAYLVFIDARTFEKQNQSLFLEYFKSRSLAWLFSSIIFLPIVLPIYLLRRFHFLKEFRHLQATTLSLAEAQEEDLAFQYTNDACGIVIIWSFAVFLFVVLLVGLRIPFPFLDLELNQSMIFAIFSSGLIIGLIFLVSRRYPYEGFLTTVGLRTRKKSFLKLVVVPFLIGLCLAALGVDIMMSRPDLPSTPLNRALEAVDSPLILFLFMGLAIFIAPFLEEIIFRGYFFTVLKKTKGKVFAVVVISLIFAVLHVDQYWGDWIAIAVVALMGFSLTLSRSWLGSTIPTIVMHYTYNFFIVFIPLASLVFSNLPLVKYQVLYPYLSSSVKEELLLESIKIQPERVEAYNDLAWLYAEGKKNLVEALDLIDKALLVSPEETAYLDTKAEIFYQMGRYDEAVAIAEELVKKNPQNKMLVGQLKKFLEGKNNSGSE